MTLGGRRVRRKIKRGIGMPPHEDAPWEDEVFPWGVFLPRWHRERHPPCRFIGGWAFPLNLRPHDGVSIKVASSLYHGGLFACAVKTNPPRR